MSLSDTLRQARLETPLTSLFPITHLNSPIIFESKQGYLGATIQVQGVPFAIAELDFLNDMSYRLHQAMLMLDERFIQYVTIHRHKENIHLRGVFKSPFAKRVNDKYHARFEGRNLYCNDIYLTTVLKGDDTSHAARSLSWLDKLSSSKHLEEKQVRREQDINVLTTKIAQLKTALAPFKPHLLGEEDSNKGYSELLQFLSLIPNGGDTIRFKQPTVYPVLANSLANTLPRETLYPEGYLGQYLCSKQLFFGQAIQFQGATLSDKRFGALLSIKQYGQHTSSLMLDSLLELDAEFILTHSFAPIPRAVALKLVDRKRGKLVNANDAGATQIGQLADLEDGLASETLRLGFHHNTLLILANSQDELERAVRDAVNRYAYAGITLVKETLGTEPAFWAQLPTNQHLITRAGLITSSNFVDFCSLHNYETGFRDGNHLGEAVTLLETPSQTPVYFNYHTKSSKTNPAKGHTAIYGATNAGKNTLVAFLDAQMGRYNNRSFFLDRDEASKIYVLSSGNSNYTVISPKYADAIQMNPLQLPDNPQNRTFIKEWFAELIKKPGENDLPSTLTEAINECVNYSFDHLERRYRNLSNISRCLPKDFERWPELRRWLRGSGAHQNGDYYWLFDNEIDALNFDFDKIGFDITYLIDEVSPLISTPVYMYLLHRMRQSLDGRLTSIIIDEFWQVLNSPFWVKHLKSWLATIRKKNGHFIFMTQTPDTVAKSAIAAEIITNVATTIYFPNPTANAAVYKTHLGLTDAEYKAIKCLTPESRLFLYKQEKMSTLCKLDLSELADETRVFSGNQQSVQLVDKLMAEVSANEADWLPLFLEQGAA